MLFATQEFAVFFVVIFFATWALSRRIFLRNLMLGLASLFFYMCWNPWYVLLILFSVASNFYASRKVHEAGDGDRLQLRIPPFGTLVKVRSRAFWLWLGIGANLAILFGYKYLGFAASTLQYLLLLGGVEWEIPFGRILLPVGISFFTFQSMSYTIDIYYRRLEPCRRFLDFMTFVAFFPQLVAGPIVRARDFVPQLAVRRGLTDAEAGRAVHRVIVGLVKKVAISDYLAINLDDRVFANPEMYSSLEVLVGVYAYGLQIYCDFSGYSDIAIGTAKLLGFDICENFNVPYRARNMQDFWRRWHISLSTWLRDYLYIPLGGNRGSAWFTYRNLFITMLLGGLWHGPSWTFVAWGGLHGIGLAWVRYQSDRRKRAGRGLPRDPWRRAWATFLTFNFVMALWVLFRAKTFGSAMAVFAAMGELTFDTVNLHASVLLALTAGYFGHIVPRRWYEGTVQGFSRLPGVAQAAGVMAVVWGLSKIASADVVPFIYFQF